MSSYPPTCQLTVRNMTTGTVYRNVSKYMAEKITSVPMNIMELALNGYISSRQIGSWKFQVIEEDTQEVQSA